MPSGRGRVVQRGEARDLLDLGARPRRPPASGRRAAGPPWTTRWPTARSPPGPIPAAATRSATSVRAAPKPSVPIRSRWPSRTDAPRAGVEHLELQRGRARVQHEHEGRGHDAPCRRWAATVARRRPATPERTRPADPGRRTLPRAPWPGEPRSREPHRSGARRRPARRRQRGRHPTAGPGGHRRDHRAARAHVRGQPQAAVLHGQPLGGAGLRPAPRRRRRRARPGGGAGRSPRRAGHRRAPGRRRGRGRLPRRRHPARARARDPAARAPRGGGTRPRPAPLRRRDPRGELAR